MIQSYLCVPDIPKYPFARAIMLDIFIFGVQGT